MKNVKWMDVVIATPMALTFASKFGVEGILITIFALAMTAALIKWMPVLRSVEKKKMVRPVVVGQEF